MSNNNQKSSNNTLARLLSKTPEQVRTYCELLDNEKRRDLYEKVLQEMRKNPEINHVIPNFTGNRTNEKEFFVPIIERFKQICNLFHLSSQ